MGMAEPAHGRRPPTMHAGDQDMVVDVRWGGRLPCGMSKMGGPLAVVAWWAATTDVVLLHAQLPPGLVANFRFSGYVHNSARSTPGLEAKAPRFAPDRFGNASQALLATGSGLVGSRSIDYFKNRRAWTWAAWARPDDLSMGDPGNLYSEGNNGLSGHISVSKGRLLVALWNEWAPGGWAILETDAVFKPGTWTHVAVTLDVAADANSGPCRIYIDGQQAKAGTMHYLRVTDARASLRQFAFGMNVGYFVGGQTFAPYAYQGVLDDVLVFDRALDPAEVARLQDVPDTLSVFPAAEITFQGVPGQRYQLQWSADLTSWSNQGEPWLGTGAEISVTIPLRNVGQRYWRAQPIP